MCQVEEQTQEWTKVFKGSRKRPKGSRKRPKCHNNPISYISSELCSKMTPEQILFLLENLLEKDFSNRCLLTAVSYDNLGFQNEQCEPEKVVNLSQWTLCRLLKNINFKIFEQGLLLIQ